MQYYGSLSCSDSPHICQILGNIGYIGDLSCQDTTHSSQIYGYVVSDSTVLPNTITIQKNAFLDRSTFSLVLRDWTYFGGHQLPDTTWVDGTFMYRWFDPYWVFYSVWGTSDNTNWSLDGYKYRYPIRQNIGSYYTSMTAPEIPGQYQLRWTYMKDSSSYAKVIAQPFTCVSSV